MLIDYIYLILIFILICFILLLIYMSYEYRDIESFIALAPLNNLITIDDKVLYNKNDYNKLVSDVAKLESDRVESVYLNILSKTNKDLTNVKILQNINNKNNGIMAADASDVFPIDKLIKTIKSKYNSQYISTIPYDNNKYGIYVNDKCLTVNGLCKDETCLHECQNTLYSSDTQKFTNNRITSSLDAAKLMNIEPYKITETSNIYPYNVFMSATNDKCLTLSNDGIGIDKCNLNNIKQRWEISPDDNICVLK